MMSWSADFRVCHPRRQEVGVCRRRPVDRRQATCCDGKLPAVRDSQVTVVLLRCRMQNGNKEKTTPSKPLLLPEKAITLHLVNALTAVTIRPFTQGGQKQTKWQRREDDQEKGVQHDPNESVVTLRLRNSQKINGMHANR